MENVITKNLNISEPISLLKAAELKSERQLTSLSEYEDFVSHQKNISFMQSAKWAQVKSNWENEAVVVRNNKGEIEGSCLVLIKKLPLVNKSLLYAPRGPVCDYNNTVLLKKIFSEIDRLAVRYNACELICDPPIAENKDSFSKAMNSLGFYLCSRNSYAQCIDNYVLDLTGKTPEEIMSGFKADWRNRIRKAVRKGVYCKMTDSSGLSDFYPLMQATGRRDKFSVRGLEYFRRFMNGLGGDCKLFICYVRTDVGEVPVSGALAVKYSGTVSYVYGASSDDYRNYYQNYLMQWSMIKWALDSGCDLYDFGGIPCYDDETNPKYGMYRFKKGFGGRVVNYAGEYVKKYSPLLCKVLDIYRRIT